MSNHQTPSGSIPAPPEGDYVRYVQLGGLDEVGLNCTLFECNGSMLMVDCGYTFPESEKFGVDYILPDWSYVFEHIDLLDGVVITHGHQDHIGALPYFLQEVDVPIYSGELTNAMIERQLEEKDIADETTLVDVDTSEFLEIGPFDVEFVHVNHSVPNARAISLGTPLGRFVVTGDWKLDQTTEYAPSTDLQTLAQMGRDGVTALFGDSTNAEVDGLSTSEQAVKKGISDVVHNSPGRVIVAQFSSNLYRVQGLIDLAYRNDRKVLLLGYSLRKNFDIAQGLGYIDLPDSDLLIKPHEAEQLPDEQLLVISTGSQAEPRASLSRMAHGDHHNLTLKDGDHVVISARVIPGNEQGIQDMVDNLVRRGAKVFQTPETSVIHGSGHACAEELKLMMNLTNPDHLVPVHGRYKMRERHAELGENVGVDDQILIENGDVLEFTHDEADVIGHVKTGRVIVDGENVGDLEDVEIRDRAELATSGIIAAFVVIERETGDLSAGPELAQHGFIGEDEEGLMQPATDTARSAINNLLSDARRDSNQVKDAVRAAIRRFFRERIDRKPVVIPIVHEL